MTSWGAWASVPTSLADVVSVRAVAEPSTSSRSIHPKFVAVPATNAARSAVGLAATRYPAARFSHPTGVPTAKESDADPLAGLLSVVPKGWLFQVIAVSVQADVTRKMSSVRHAAEIAEA